MTYAVLDTCTACGACLLTCPEHALVPTLPLTVRADRCTRCGECVEICPADALVELPGPPPAGHAEVTRGARSAPDHNCMIGTGVRPAGGAP